MPEDHLAVPQLELAILRKQLLGLGQELVGRHFVLRQVGHDDVVSCVYGSAQRRASNLVKPIASDI
jgi:hypothetical protein